MFGKNLSFIVLLLLVAFNILSAQDTQDSKLGFSKEHGFYSAPFELQITSSVLGAEIRYTLDGTNPLKSSTAIKSGTPAILKIDPSINTNRDRAPGFIVVACAVLNDTLASKIITQTYLFPQKIIELSPHNQVPGKGWLVPGSSSQQISYGLDPRVYNNAAYKPYMTEAFNSLPTVSLVTDLNNLFNPDSGIYVNALLHGEEWERTASLEMLNPDSSEGFQINCGIRVRGGWSRNTTNPKHAYRIFFRNEYGKSKLQYPLFGDEGAKEFDKLDLQTSQNYSWAYEGSESNTFLRELFSRDTQRDMGQPYTRGRFCHLFVNGTYFGIFQFQERSEASYAESYFGGNKEDYDVIKVNIGNDLNLYDVEATDGTLAKWQQLWLAGQNGFSSDEAYLKVQGLNVDGTVNPAYERLLDVDNLIDYMIITFFVGDPDGPIAGPRGNNDPNNFYAIYNRVKPDGFKFFRHDAEHSLFVDGMGSDRTGPYPAGNTFNKSNPQWIHQKLSENSNYRLRFADRVYNYFYNNSVLSLSKNVDRLMARKKQLEMAIIAESARWGDSKTAEPRTKTDWNNAVNYIIQNFLPTRINTVRNQLINKGLFSNIQPPQFSRHGGIVEKGFAVSLSAIPGNIYYTIDGTDPYLPYVSADSVFKKTVVTSSATKKVIVPKTTYADNWFKDVSFDDSGWLTCSGEPGGVGYEAQTGYEPYISLSTKNYMYTGASSPNNSCYIRIPFEISADELSHINTMTLEMMYDDGFVAYINGVKVTSDNVPAALNWNSVAPSALSADAEKFVTFDISAFAAYLKAGKNLLAIQGMNNATNSSDFLILPKLTVARTAQSGIVSPTAILYKDPISVKKTMTIKARTYTGSSWSPLNEVTYYINEDLSKLKVTELNYHPIGQDTISDKMFEFIEMKNCGSEELTLNGASFVNGIDYTFGDKILTPGEFLVLASNKEQFNKRYGFMPYDVYEGQLDNSGEGITFINSVKDTVFSFVYDDKFPWPEEADGKRYSLVSRSSLGDGNPGNASYWIRSAALNGSPGKDDPATGIAEEKNNVIIEYELKQNYPNPFNPETIISYDIPKGSNVELKIYDVLGQEVKELVNRYQGAGKYNVRFNAGKLTSGIYFYMLKAGNFIKTNKMILVK